MSLAPGARLGPYEIHSPLGSGGMGEVYKARGLERYAGSSRSRRGHMSTLGSKNGMSAVVALAVLSHILVAQSGEKMVTPSDVNWPTAAAAGVGTSGVTGVQTVALKGDPTKPGLYTLLLRAGPNMTIEAHSHPDDRVATVVSGTWYFGYGQEFNKAALKALPAGSFYTEPPNAPHFAMTQQEAVVIQITGIGPSGTTYVDPRNDLTRKN
jgi:quercetin dioxygenase-like cupin family protein